MTTVYGQITEAEAVERGLVEHAHRIDDLDGTPLRYHRGARVYWIRAADMPSTPQPAGWKAGHSGQPA